MFRFSISHETIGDGVDLITVSGALDAHTFEQLEEVINNLLAEGRFRLVVDMTRVNYISSAGVGVLIAAANETEASGGKVVLMSPTKEVGEVLDTLGLAEMFTTVGDRREALAAF